MTSIRFDGRVAVVTGAGTGIGAEHARLLASRGAAVIVNDLDGAAAERVVAEIAAADGTALAVTSDIAGETGAREAIDAARNQFGRLDVVVNNAGVLVSSPFAELTVEQWDHIVAVNLRGTFLICHAAWPLMVEQGYGRIVSTTSNSGLLGVKGSTAYASAKAAIWGLTRSLSLEGAELGINVNAIAPMAYTAMSAGSKIAPKAWRSGEGDDWSRRLDVALVSPATAWLAHESCEMNGQVLSVIGGRVARFALRVTDGFDQEDLTPEIIRDHHEQLLDPNDVGTEFRAAFEEGRAMHRRLMP